MDMVGKSFVQDRKMVRNGLLKPEIGLQVEERGDSSTTGDQSKLTASTAVEGLDRDKFIIRIGAIGCTTFSLNKCSFGSA